MSKRRGKTTLRPKSKEEAINYRNSIKHTSFSPLGTDLPSNDALCGSDELYGLTDNAEQNIKSIPTPKRIQFSRWFKENTWQILIVVILGGVISWLCLSTIDLKIKTTESLVRIEMIKEQINNMDNKSVDKKLLDLELEAIEKDISNLKLLSIDPIVSRIDALEIKINQEKESGIHP